MVNGRRRSGTFRIGHRLRSPCDGLENAARILASLDRHRKRHHAVIVINCLGALMRRTRLGDHEFAAWFEQRAADNPDARWTRCVRQCPGWPARALTVRRSTKRNSTSVSSRAFQAFLWFVPSTGKLAPIKQYLTLFFVTFFSRPPETSGQCCSTRSSTRFLVTTGKSERLPHKGRRATGIYHPDAPLPFDSFEAYRTWYERRKRYGPAGSAADHRVLLLRPQVVSEARRHYDAVIEALEAEGLGVLPCSRPSVDNREACKTFLVICRAIGPRIAGALADRLQLCRRSGDE